MELLAFYIYTYCSLLLYVIFCCLFYSGCCCCDVHGGTKGIQYSLSFPLAIIVYWIFPQLPFSLLFFAFLGGLVRVLLVVVPISIFSFFSSRVAFFFRCYTYSFYLFCSYNTMHLFGGTTTITTILLLQTSLFIVAQCICILKYCTVYLVGIKKGHIFAMYLQLTNTGLLRKCKR